MAKSLDSMNCSWSRALSIVGDKWTMLIIREMFFGTNKFSEFQKNTGIAKNILSNRLDHLQEHQILERVPEREGGTRFIYRLTPKGRALFPAVIALGQWGDKWIFGAEGEPVTVVDRETHAPIQTIGVISRDGRYLEPNEVLPIPGPSANDDTRAKIAALAKKRGM